MKLHSKAVHAGDRKAPGRQIPVTTPIYASSSFFYDDIESVDQALGNPESGFAYTRYHNPTNAALEELVAELEEGAGALATSSGMAAIRIALEAALLDRPKRVLAATALYGATIKLLDQVMELFGCEIHYADVNDLDAFAAKAAKVRPGAVLVETISNPLLRVPEIDRLAEIARAQESALIVDSTFATPLLVRPLELGAHLVVHSATKFLSGHGDVLGGFVISDESHLATVRSLSRLYGPIMGPFNAYLAMRGIKTFPLRMERQCRNAACVSEGLRKHPRVERVYSTSDPAHPDASTIARLMPPGLTGAMVSFEIAGAGREEVFAFLNRLKMVVPATSLGDVHSMVLYPVMASHRDLAPKQRERLGIRDNLVRLSTGIEDPADILDDLSQALG
jgi:cystathionine beta-lyase/cystathionine gamma-synthase